eukprot:EG_transcript_4983
MQMAVADRPKTSSYLSHEFYTADVRDHQDHTFCGIMFDVRCQSVRPVEYVEVQSLWVRGDLGPVKVFVVPGGYRDPVKNAEEVSNAVHKTVDQWTLVFEATLPASMDTLQELVLTSPLRLCPGDTYGVYVHSALPGDRGLVYDNQRSKVTHSDAYLQILPGLAHVSFKPFGRDGPWRQGRAWRAHRQFVGRVSYGVRWKLWTPETHLWFPVGFRRLTHCLVWAAAQPGCTLQPLPLDVLLYILNLCRWDWGAGFQPQEEELWLSNVTLSGLSRITASGDWEELEEAIICGSDGQPGLVGDCRPGRDTAGAGLMLVRLEDFRRGKRQMMQNYYRAHFLEWGDTGANLLLDGLPEDALQCGTQLEFGRGGCVVTITARALLPSTNAHAAWLGMAEVIRGTWCVGASCKVVRGGQLTAGQPVYVQPTTGHGPKSSSSTSDGGSCDPLANDVRSPRGPVQALVRRTLEAIQGAIRTKMHRLKRMWDTLCRRPYRTMAT